MTTKTTGGVRVELAGGEALEIEAPRLAPNEPIELRVGGDVVTACLFEASREAVTLEVDGRRWRFGVESVDEANGGAPGCEVCLSRRGRRYRLRLTSELDRLRAEARPRKASGPATLSSALPGVVRQVLVEVGALVAEGEALLTLEAMKMENEIRAEIAGRVEALHVAAGDVVAARQPLARIVPVGE